MRRKEEQEQGTKMKGRKEMNKKKEGWGNSSDVPCVPHGSWNCLNKASEIGTIDVQKWQPRNNSSSEPALTQIHSTQNCKSNNINK